MIYALTYKTVCFLVFIGVVLWTIPLMVTKLRERVWKILNTFLCLIAVYLVLRYTVLYRIPSNNHQFMFWAPFSNEFYREMLMNAFLFYPLGLTLTVLIGPWSILVSGVLSFVIELWQYVLGTGIAQGSDVLMNTLGCVIGAVPYFIGLLLKKISKKHQ